MKQLNVCLLNDSFPPVIDGVANCVVNYADIIHRKFGNAVVCTPSYPNAEDHYPYPVVRYPSFDMTRTFGYRAGFPLDKKTILTLAQKRLDIIHTHSPVMSGVLARTMREVIQKPIVLTYHSKFDVDIRKDIKSKTIQDQAISAILANIDSCDEVWTVSRGAGENLRSLGFEGDYIVMENGVDLPKGAAPQEALDKLYQEYRLRKDIPVLIFVGRMMWYKGLRLILDGLSLMKRQGVPFQMLLVGGGTNEAEIREYAASLGLNDHCRFIEPVTDREKLRAFYSCADLFLFPSDYDTNGLVVREAAACGTGSLTLKNSCASEGIEHMRNGIVIDATPEALAAETTRLLNTPGAARLLGQNAMNDLYLSWEESVTRAYRRYGEVIERFYSDRRIRRGKSDALIKTIAKLYKTED